LSETCIAVKVARLIVPLRGGGRSIGGGQHKKATVMNFLKRESQPSYSPEWGETPGFWGKKMQRISTRKKKEKGIKKTRKRQMPKTFGHPFWEPGRGWGGKEGARKVGRTLKGKMIRPERKLDPTGNGRNKRLETEKKRGQEDILNFPRGPNNMLGEKVWSIGDPEGLVAGGECGKEKKTNIEVKIIGWFNIYQSGSDYI